MHHEPRDHDDPRPITPRLIGIAGGSGSGKTTFARDLRRRLGEDRSVILHQDAYYRDHGGALGRGAEQVNFDHPNALDFRLLLEHLVRIKRRQSIEVPRYDYGTHRRLAASEPLAPHPWILLEGILVLSEPAVRDHLDVKIFIETPEEVRLARRIARDTRERGRDEAGVRRQFLAQVKPMHDRFVEPSRCYADRVYSGEDALDGSVRDLVAWLDATPDPSG